MKYDIANEIPLCVGAGVASCLLYFQTATDVHDEGCVSQEEGLQFHFRECANAVVKEKGTFI